MPEHRAFWLEWRRGLLTQLAALEQVLGIERKCPHCGHALGDKARG